MFACVVALIVACTPLATLADIEFVNVSYQSSVVDSGQITLHGTVVKPKGNGPFYGAVLISGSGPNNRWETDGPLEPLRDIAVQLATKADMAVLVYDKRSCGSLHGCTYQYCNRNVTTNCVILQELNVFDFASDASTSLEFLADQLYTHASSLTVIGHSQGTHIAPLVASTHTQIVSRMALLMGYGLNDDEILQVQSQRQLPLFEDQLAYWSAQPDSPMRSQNIIQLQGTISSYQCTIHNAVPQYNLLRDGTISPDSTQSIICPLGAFDQRLNRTICPSNCGSGICQSGNNTHECLLECNLGYSLGICQFAKFSASQIELGDPLYQRALLSNVSGSILTVNSWTDLLIPPSAFGPLLNTLQTNLSDTLPYVTGTPGPINSVETNVFANLTHMMTRYLDGSSVHVVPEVLNAITEFVLDNQPITEQHNDKMVHSLQAGLIVTSLIAIVCVSALVYLVARGRTSSRHHLSSLDPLLN